MPATLAIRRILPSLLLIGLFAIETWAWGQFASGNDVTGKESMGLWTHVIVASLVALVGSFSIERLSIPTRVTLVILFFILAGILPLAGVLVVLALSWVLSTPASTGERPEDRYVFGNPMAVAARRESRKPLPELSSLSEAMRSFSLLELEKMIHGLRYLHPSRLTLHFLRRFQTDPASNLQFASQGVITANLERLESQLKTVTARLATATGPAAIDSHLAVAEILLELAAWTPAGDATAQVYLDDSLKHTDAVLQAQPESQRALHLQALAYIALDETIAAEQRIARLTDPALQDLVLISKMEVELRASKYTHLPSLAKRLKSAPPEVNEVIGFWTGSISAPAALRAKS
jgi:hypothetical protein